MSLRARLLIALGYLVALVIVAFAVPLGANLRDRVGNEVRATAPHPGRRARRRRAAADRDARPRAARRAGAARSARPRGRASSWSTAAGACSPTPPTPRRSASTSPAGPSWPRRCGGRPVPGRAALGDARQVDPRHRPAGVQRGRGGRRGAAHAERRRRQRRGPPHRARDRRRRAGRAAGRARRRVPARARDHAPDRAARRRRRHDLLRRPRRARGGRGQPRAALARPLVQPDDRAARPRAARADGVRRRRVAPAPHAAHRACGCGSRRRAPRRTGPTRSATSTPAWRSSTACRQTIDDLLVLSRTGRARGRRARRSTSPRPSPTRAGAGSAPRRRATSPCTPSPTAPAPCGRRAPTSTARSTRCVENAIHYTPAGGHVTVRGAAARRSRCSTTAPASHPGEEDDVFARFHRGSAGRGGAPGTGLGLPIARELMRTLGRRRGARQPARGRHPGHADRPGLYRLFPGRVLTCDRCASGCCGSGSAC